MNTNKEHKSNNPKMKVGIYQDHADKLLAMYPSAKSLSDAVRLHLNATLNK